MTLSINCTGAQTDDTGCQRLHMSLSYNKRADGSAVLYIDGDLQFDTRDEAVYHESLVFPALTVLSKRRSSERALKTLVLGGGDGLVVRELLKSELVESIVVAEYDASIIALTRSKLNNLSANSLENKRVTLAVGDCRDFIRYATEDGLVFDLIIADLTVPQSIDAAGLHNIDFYQNIVKILKADGLIASNAISPSKFPDAYWCIYNSMRTATFNVRPYRIVMPSFQAEGYGPDWGFFIASRQPIAKDELCHDGAIPKSNTQLKSGQQIERLFAFPEQIAARRELSRPAAANSDILLHYLGNANTNLKPHKTDWTSLSFEVDTITIPEADAGDLVLPHEVCLLVRESIDKEILFDQVIELMPSLRSTQTREMIEAFLEGPSRFLRSIDLQALVDKLIERAEELPKKLLAELKELKVKLQELAGDYERLLQMGLKIVTIATLVVIVGNLLSPDAVYGKGGGGEGAHGAFAGEAHGFSQISHTRTDGAFAEPQLATGTGFRNYRSSSMSLDEYGTAYPMRSYRYYDGYNPYFYRRRYYGNHQNTQQQQTNDAKKRLKTAHGIFRLSPEADVLEDGRIVIALTDGAYLFLDPESTSVIDSQTGESVMELSADPAQLWRVQKEVDRQKVGIINSLAAKQEWINWVDWLGFMPWREDDLTEMKNLFEMSDRLSAAQKCLGAANARIPQPFTPPVKDAIEVINTIWLMPDGKSVLIWLPENKFAYMTATNWYSDPQLSKPLTNPPFSPKFKSVIKALLVKGNKEQDVEKQNLMRELNYAQTDMRSLEQDKKDYNQCRGDTQMWEMVDYGSTQISLEDALKRTDVDMASTAQRVKILQDQVGDLPREAQLRATLLEHF